MAITNFAIFSVLFVAAFAEFNVIEFEPCTGRKNLVPSNNCTVTKVRMDPCETPPHCSFKRNQNATLYIDLVPKFVTSNLYVASVFWEGSHVSDNAFGGMGTTDGCGLTTCPTKAGTSQTLIYQLHKEKVVWLPKGFLTMMLTVTNRGQVCCFLTNFELKT